MTIPVWHEVPISKNFDRESFDCGEPALNDFLQRHARKSHIRGGAKTFLAVEEAGGKKFNTSEKRLNLPESSIIRIQEFLFRVPF